MTPTDIDEAIDDFARAVNEDTFAYECGRGGDKQGVDKTRAALLAAIAAAVRQARVDAFASVSDELLRRAEEHPTHAEEALEEAAMWCTGRAASALNPKDPT